MMDESNQLHERATFSALLIALVIRANGLIGVYSCD